MVDRTVPRFVINWCQVTYEGPNTGPSGSNFKGHREIPRVDIRFFPLLVVAPFLPRTGETSGASVYAHARTRTGTCN